MQGTTMIRYTAVVVVAVIAACVYAANGPVFKDWPTDNVQAMR